MVSTQSTWVTLLASVTHPLVVSTALVEQLQPPQQPLLQPQHLQPQPQPPPPPQLQPPQQPPPPPQPQLQERASPPELCAGTPLALWVAPPAAAQVVERTPPAPSTP